MKKIQPITIWKNGESQEANLLLAYITNDDLQKSCTFCYILKISGEGTDARPFYIGQSLSEGTITMSGDDYLAWDNSNEAAYVYIAEKLNLTLIA
jgi:hypothetical protein